MASHAHRCWVEIDLAALERNLGRIRSALPGAIQYVAVVKADAYGHGLAPTAARLMQCGADLFAVANVEEARVIREIGGGWPILLLSAVLPSEEPLLIHYDLIPTLSSEEELDRFAALAQAHRCVLPVHLKIDTGMGRLGVWYEQAATLAGRLHACPHLRLDGLYTHFSCADTDPDYTGLQRRRFLDLLPRLLPPSGESILIHADNSAGLETFRLDSPFNAVRVGLLQFGILPRPDSLLGRVHVEPVLSFHARVGLLKDLPAGAALSYGATCCLSRPARLAVLTAGYADGIPLSLSNRGEVLLAGHRCPILGRVTMDQTLVDVTGLPGLSVGDTATLIGSQGNEAISAADFAARAASIPYEMLTSITRRVTRLYKTSRDL